MENNYKIKYIDENKFRKLEKTLKKYNIQAYKKLLFQYYPNLNEGNFEGNIIKQNQKEGLTKYELKLSTDDTFRFVHGSISLIYTVNKKEKLVILETLHPENLLLEGFENKLTTYKGVPVSKANKQKDMFKIDLLNSLSNNLRNNIKDISNNSINHVKKVIKEEPKVNEEIEETTPTDNKKTIITNSNTNQTKTNNQNQLKEKLKIILIIYLIFTLLISFISLIMNIYD